MCCCYHIGGVGRDRETIFKRSKFHHVFCSEVGEEEEFLCKDARQTCILSTWWVKEGGEGNARHYTRQCTSPVFCKRSMQTSPIKHEPLQTVHWIHCKDAQKRLKLGKYCLLAKFPKGLNEKELLVISWFVCKRSHLRGDTCSSSQQCSQATDQGSDIRSLVFQDTLAKCLYL